MNTQKSFVLGHETGFIVRLWTMRFCKVDPFPYSDIITPVPVEGTHIYGERIHRNASFYVFRFTRSESEGGETII